MANISKIKTPDNTTYDIADKILRTSLRNGTFEPLLSEWSEYAVNDAEGNDIIDTYETKADASSKLIESKDYTDERIDSLQANIDTLDSVVNDSIKGLSASGTTITYTKNDGTTGTFITQDTQVLQQVAENTWTAWRPIVFGSQSSATETFAPEKTTASVYTATPFKVQPSTGTMSATIFKGSLAGNATSATTLTGLTSTIAELNYVDGVTSNIQTQLNGKASTSTATTSANGLLSSSDKTKINYTNVAFGTCSTYGATAAKVVTLQGNTNWTLTDGALIFVNFTAGGIPNTSTATTLNVNNTGAKQIYYQDNQLTSTTAIYGGLIYGILAYVYDATQGVYHYFGGYDKDINSHYTGYLRAGASTGTSNAAVATSPYLKFVENNTVRSTVRLIGSNGITVTSDSRGNVTISGSGTSSGTTTTTISPTGITRNTVMTIIMGTSLSSLSSYSYIKVDMSAFYGRSSQAGQTNIPSIATTITLVFTDKNVIINNPADILEWCGETAASASKAYFYIPYTTSGYVTAVYLI